MILLWLLRCHWGRWEGLTVTGSLAIQPYWKEPGVGWEPHQGHLDLKKQAETFHSLGTCEESSWHFHRTSCFCARFSNFKVCFGGTYWNALSFSEAPQNGTESENCGSISTVSLKITGKISDFGEAKKAYDDLSPRVLEPEVLKSFMTFSTCTSKTSESWSVRARLSPFIF